MGYVDTSYASQGKTVDRVFVAVGSESLPAANMKQWYVSLSRGKEMAKVYVEDKKEVRDAIAKGSERLSAVELTHTKLRDSWWRKNPYRLPISLRIAGTGSRWLSGARIHSICGVYVP
jgi:hypothetical protein